MDVAIIDYKMSNLHSVQAACNKVGLSSLVTSDKEKILSSKAAILPGVGAFGKTMDYFCKSKLDECIYEFIDSGKPFVGICLGLQLLFDSSEEFGDNVGLGIISGHVRKFENNTHFSIKYPVPHIGWNKIHKTKNTWDNTLLCDNKDGDFMYFIHSYYVEPKEEEVVLSKTTYGKTEYCSSINYKNIFGSQFHPEKSGSKGIEFYYRLKKLIQEGL